MMDPFELSRFPRRLRNAAHGLAFLMRESANARIHLLATIVVTTLGIVLHIGLDDWLWLTCAIGAVWTAEAVNTALETLANRVTTQRDPLIGLAKDLAAGAVLLAAGAATATGLLVFIPRLVAI